MEDRGNGNNGDCERGGKGNRTPYEQNVFHLT